jgi:anaerobic magnesium-protoporphyrin IX monomethyl ester cyclase
VNLKQSLNINSNPKVLFIYLQQDYYSISPATRTHDGAVMTPTVFSDTASIQNVTCRPLLGLQYLAGSAASIGVESAILDRRIIEFNEETLAEYVDNSDVMLVGFYTSFAHTDSNCVFIKKLKTLTNVPIIVGGPGYTEGDILLRSGADLVCNGEGEDVIKVVIKEFLKGDPDWTTVAGISYVKEGEIVNKGMSPQISNLDEVAFPIRNDFDISSYKDYLIPGFRLPYITMFTNRGCPHACIYCDSPNLWQKEVRHRSPDNVLEEIDIAVKRWGVRYIDFVDDVFGINHKWLEEFCSKLAERKYDLKYKALMNPSTFGKKQEKAFALLAKSGCNVVGMGMQSADDDMLNFLDRKSDTPERLINAITHANKNEILTFVSFIVGFPNESDTIPQQIIDLARKAQPLLIDCYPLVTLKGTKLDDMLESGDAKLPHSFNERKNRAIKIKRSFYSSPVVFFRLFKWLLLNNRSWLYFMLSRSKFFLDFLSVSKKSAKSSIPGI